MSSNETNDLELFKVQSEKNFFNENHFSVQCNNINSTMPDNTDSNHDEEQNSVDKTKTTNTQNEYLIGAKAALTLNSEEDSNELSTKASSKSSRSNVPCALIKLESAESNESLGKKSSLKSEGICYNMTVSNSDF